MSLFYFVLLFFFFIHLFNTIRMATSSYWRDTAVICQRKEIVLSYVVVTRFFTFPLSFCLVVVARLASKSFLSRDTHVTH